MTKSNPPPAFPQANRLMCSGMTLRDYFAAKVLQGIMANRVLASDKWTGISIDAYEAADAMLKERVREVLE